MWKGNGEAGLGREEGQGSAKGPGQDHFQEGCWMTTYT